MSVTKYALLLGVAALTTGGATNVSAQTPAAARPSNHGALRMAARTGVDPEGFVTHAALDGMTEVQLGKIALNNSQNPSIRQFAQRMVQEHGKANAELMTLAQRKGLQVPATLDTEHQEAIQALSAKSGAAFDAAYVEHMATAHDTAIALFEGGAESSDPDLAAFARKTLPTLQAHKKMAVALPKQG